MWKRSKNFTEIIRGISIFPSSLSRCFCHKGDNCFLFLFLVAELYVVLLLNSSVNCMKICGWIFAWILRGKKSQKWHVNGTSWMPKKIYKWNLICQIWLEALIKGNTSLSFNFAKCLTQLTTPYAGLFCSKYTMAFFSFW